MALGPGSLLGTNIVLERQLGEGAMGAVWIAENRSLHSKVAVKVLHRDLSNEPEALARFQQEARAVANIDSPHVVQIFDFGTTPEGEPYIVMELLHGRDLREVIEQDGSLPIDRAAVVVQQLCRALGRAHELGLIHRDIKPANVFLVESDGEPFVKVLDFGIARYLSDNNLNMTETGAVMGTPYYMSPEQFVDPRRIDHRSDLWSAAIVAYGCLMGTLPFLGETIGALSLAVHQGTFQLPSQVNPSLPVALDAFFQRALQVDRNHRYGSAKELSNAFVAATGSVPSSVAPHLAGITQTPAGPYPHAAAAPPTAAGMQPSTHGALPSHVVPTALPPSAAVPAPTPNTFSHTHGAPPEKKKGSGALWVGISLAVVGLGSLAVAFALPALQADERTANEDDGAQSKSEGKSKKKKSKKKKKKKAEEPDDSERETVAPEPAPSATEPAGPEPSPTPSATASTPAPAPPPPPAAPKPAPLRYASMGTSCVGFKNGSCGLPAKCCSGPRDVLRWNAPAAGKDYATCTCYRPVCGPGQNWQTHQCVIK